MQFLQSLSLLEGNTFTSRLYPDCYILGPRTYPDGRKFVEIQCRITKKRLFSIMYSRLLMQEKIGRLLTKDEEVDHIDENCMNDNIDNLLLMSKTEHRAMHHAYVGLKTYEFKCCLCDKKIILTRKQFTSLRSKLKKGQTGPYCDRKCVALYRHQF